MGTSLNTQAWSTTAASNNTADTGLPTIADTMAPTDVDNTMRGMMAALKRYVLDVGGGPSAVGGTADAITITTNQSISSAHEAAGFSIRFKAGGTNTGAVTVAVDGLTAQALERMDGTALSAGDIVSGGIYDIAYNATNGGYTLMTGVNLTNVVLLAANNAFTGTNTFSLSSAAAVPVEIISTEAGAAAGPLLSLYRNSASPADADVGPAIYFYGKDSGGTKTLFASVTSVFDDITDATEDSSLHFSVMTAGTLADEWTMTGAGFYPTTNDGGSLGISGNAVSDAFFASGAVLNFNAGNYTVTHSAGLLTASGALTVNGNITGGGNIVAVGGLNGASVSYNSVDILTSTFADSLLDTLGTETTGALLYHNGSSWVVLAPP